MKKIIFTLVYSCCFFIFLLSFSSAGNKKLIEDEVKELDKLNKQAIDQISDLPKDGHIDFKANVSSQGEVQTYEFIEIEIEIDNTSIKNESLSFNNSIFKL